MSKFDPYEHLNVTLNDDGTLTRYLNIPKLPATGEDQILPGQTAVSKDVTLNADNKTWMRIYRPTQLSSNNKKLPIILFLHAGGWIDLSVANVFCHETCNKMSHEIPAIVIGLEFRLAPEHRLPAQYDDAVETINWVKNQALDPKGDQWLRDYADYSRFYLYGASCGANIAYNAALRILQTKMEPLKIVGLIMNQPFIGGMNRDHRFCNPLQECDKEKLRSIGRCLVIGFGGDPLIDRQQEFVKMLVMSGVMVEAKFDDVGFHNIDMIDPRRAAAILDFIKEFV
ncbi:putative carboxylesterase 9 [Heracleum sosnowskyi]|uniref:Carboxylesterase 9 n=1 Tax=Heracleum sosnowskyi TaxID=360622 RepID=A0AAD8MX89_9APIA|nr:putative carboxylesterase 9 [Heracleum sosnowskyi]